MNQLLSKKYQFTDALMETNELYQQPTKSSSITYTYKITTSPKQISPLKFKQSEVSSVHGFNKMDKKPHIKNLKTTGQQNFSCILRSFKNQNLKRLKKCLSKLILSVADVVRRQLFDTNHNKKGDYEPANLDAVRYKPLKIPTFFIKNNNN